MEKTPETQQEEKFTKMMLKQRKSRKVILDFLPESDKQILSHANRKLRRCIITEKGSAQNVDTFDDMVRKFIKKAEKKPDGNYVKGSLFDLNPKAIEKHKWILLNPTEDSNKKIATELPGMIPDKLLKDYSWFIYHASDIQKFICVHRSLVDPTLEFFYKENLRKRDHEKVEQEGVDPEFQKALEEYSIDKFIAIPNGLMIRQKLLDEKKKMLSMESEDKKIKDEIGGLLRASQAHLMTFVLCEGGNFSIGVFDREKEVTHMSDHRYVVRKKQGKRQLVKDKSKEGIQSVGSQIRRANEVKHQEAIEDIVEDLHEFIEKSEFVFIHAPGENTSILFDEGKALFDFKRQQHFKSLCYTAKKANYSEIKSIRDTILKVYIISENSLVG